MAPLYHLRKISVPSYWNLKTGVSGDFVPLNGANSDMHVLLRCGTQNSQSYYKTQYNNYDPN